MKLVLCSVFDVKSAAFSNPQSFRSNGEAIRSFCDAVDDERSQFCKHPSDYVFYKVGYFDDVQGQVVPDLVKLIEGSEARAVKNV